MNQCILMAEVVQPPQTRYTPDQTAIAEMVVQFPGLRPEDPAATLKVVGWGNLAQEVQERCKPGQSYVFEGRLRMSTFERPEGFKEKVAELNISRLYAMDGSAMALSSAQPDPTAAAPAPRVQPPAQAVPQPSAAAPEPDYDDIPF